MTKFNLVGARRSQTVYLELCVCILWVLEKLHVINLHMIPRSIFSHVKYAYIYIYICIYIIFLVIIIKVSLLMVGCSNVEH